MYTNELDQLITPFVVSDMLVTEPIVFLFALWTAFTFLAVFLFFDAIPVVFSTSYGFNVQPFGAVFTALFVGTFIGTMCLY